jgi:magnesium chelatase family protein
LLPPLSHSESLEVTAIHSVAGLLSGSTPLITRPPFVAPHHTSSVASLVGGGTGMARPGAVSRAHRGVLFDECAEIGVSALEALRTPLEDGEIRLARRDGVARYPARFQLVPGAANPCRCAPADSRDCICAPMAKRRYRGKLSGPLLDRVDLRVQMHTERAGAFAAEEAEPTARVRELVEAARVAAAQRWQPHGIHTNAEVSGPCCGESSDRSPRPWSPFEARSTAACSVSEASTAHCGWRTYAAIKLGVSEQNLLRRNQSRLPMGLTPCVHQTGSSPVVSRAAGGL